MHNFRFPLRTEQYNAIEQTYRYWQTCTPSNNKFLWNAKPRFGKTLAAYCFAEQIQAKRILIITHRPALSDAWTTDFFTKSNLSKTHLFGSNKKCNLQIDKKSYHVYSRSELASDQNLLNAPLVYFASLQSLKTAMNEAKTSSNHWLLKGKMNWDLLIIDEGHEGVKTAASENVLCHIKTNFKLYLSGTPFRMLADRDFNSEQIFNWSYLDEQKAKRDYVGVNNPYADLPKLEFDIYELHNILEKVESYSDLFRIHNHSFVYQAKIEQLIEKICNIFQNSHGPDLNHTFWLLPGAEECKLFAQILAHHHFLADCKIVLAIGKNNYLSNNAALRRVHLAMGDNPSQTKTVTLSCGQLTTGVTIPEWGATLMLYASDDINRASLTQYIQSAFRSQTPWARKNWHKTTAHIIDFVPERCLALLDKYANNLSRNFNDLLKYLDIVYHDTDSKHLLTAHDALQLLRKIVAQEIINAKFQNTDKLFNPYALENLSETSSKILDSLRGIHKQRRSQPQHSAKAHRKLSTLQTSTNLEEVHDGNNRTRNLRREQMRALTSAIPHLLHLYDPPKPTLEELIKVTPDDAFIHFMNISKKDFQNLYQEQCFDEQNCAVAIDAFVKQEMSAASYYKNNVINIFDLISPLASREVFTKQDIASKVFQAAFSYYDLPFRSAATRFLDLSARSGNMLVPVVKTLFSALQKNYQSAHDALLHIFTEQIYTWSPNKFDRLSAINNLLGFARFHHVEFTNSELFRIKQNFKIYNPLQEKRGINHHAVFEYIYKEYGDNMKFDVILSNPPYQVGRRQVYADFYRLAVGLNPEILCMIFPVGWQKPHNHNGLGQLNNPKYKRDKHLVSIDIYDESKNSQKLFQDLGTGGVNIVLRDSTYDNHGKIKKLINGQPKGNITLALTKDDLEKPEELKSLITLLESYPKISALGSSRKPYGLAADALRAPEKYQLPTYDQRCQNDDVRLFGLMMDGARGYKFIPRSFIGQPSPHLDTYKLFIPKAWGNMSERIGLGGSYANICVAAPGDACTETFIEFGPFASQSEAIIMAKYFMTKFFRALLFLAKDSQNTSRDKYRHIPLPDFSDQHWQKPISELDEFLFHQFKIPVTSQKFIRANIQPRAESNIEIL